MAECIVTVDRRGLNARKKETRDEPHCNRPAGVVARWRTAHLAAQRELGILPKWGLSLILLVQVILALTGRLGRPSGALSHW